MIAREKVTAAAGDDAAFDGSGLTPVEGELEALWRLGLEAVRRRWRSLVGRPMPRGMGRGLILRILAHYAQVQQHGGLDRASQRTLAEFAGQQLQELPAVVPVGESPVSISPSEKVVRSPDLLRPGTLLSREYAGILHKVTVLDAGFGWNGEAYDSLSQVTLAITGTRWNGPRFFGLRDKPERRTGKTLVGANGARLVTGRGRAVRKGPSPARSVAR